MAVINVGIAIKECTCNSCGGDFIIYHIYIGGIAFFLCEDCATSLYRAIEAEVIVPDQREW